jgi:hypothetical protein
MQRANIDERNTRLPGDEMPGDKADLTQAQVKQQP